MNANTIFVKLVANPKDMDVRLETQIAMNGLLDAKEISLKEYAQLCQEFDAIAFGESIEAGLLELTDEECDALVEAMCATAEMATVAMMEEYDLPHSSEELGLEEPDDMFDPYAVISECNA